MLQPLKKSQIKNYNIKHGSKPILLSLSNKCIKMFNEK